jgi:hypothetical protein
MGPAGTATPWACTAVAKSQAVRTTQRGNTDEAKANVIKIQGTKLAFIVAAHIAKTAKHNSPHKAGC